MILSLLALSACGPVVRGVSPAAWDAVVVDTLGDAQVVDARSAAAFEAGHVPGARQVHASDLTGPDDDGLWGAVDPEIGAALLAARGIGTDRPVVVYGSGPGGSGDDGNVYWALRWLGHPDVRVYDGGWLAWVARGEDPESGPAQAATATFDLDLDDAVLVGTDDVESWDGVVLDVRSREEFDAGHVPGAVWLEWTRVFDADETLRPPDELRAMLADEAGIGPDTPVVTYCQAGIRAGHSFMVLDALGQPVANYVGSWARWTAEGGAIEVD